MFRRRPPGRDHRCTIGGITLALVAVIITLQCSGAELTDAEHWWRHIEYLAADERQGRETGSEGYQQAANYVAREFEKLGAEPAGTEGFFQPIPLVERRIVEEGSFFELHRDGEVIPLELRKDVIHWPVGAPGEVEDIELVFIGYGLTVPEANYDDRAGLELTGKVGVTFQGAPKSIPSLLAAHYSSLEQMIKAARAAGIVGNFTLANPSLQEIPWDRMALMQAEPRMQLADPQLALDINFATVGGNLVNPESASKLLDGSGYTYERLLDLASTGEPLPRFPLKGTLRGRREIAESKLTSSNVIGMLRGVDPDLRDEYVLLSAHLDHVGVGEPIEGDAIRNGAMDNASGVAALLEVVRMIYDAEVSLRRSVLILTCTGEEKGLLGSKYFAARPTVPIENIVANVNLDMFLPLTPLKMVCAFGLQESDLAERVDAAAAEKGIAVQDDLEPQRNRFIRSDQYSFIKRGIPSLVLKFGYAPDSPEADIHHQWFRDRYHGPTDDLNQPVNKEAAAEFNRFMAELTLQIANADERPQWREDSFFSGFAQ